MLHLEAINTDSISIISVCVPCHNMLMLIFELFLLFRSRIPSLASLSILFSLSLSHWRLCFHYCIIHHSDLCVLWYPGVFGWVEMCLLCRGRVPQVIITSDGSVLLVCVILIEQTVGKQTSLSSPLFFFLASIFSYFPFGFIKDFCASSLWRIVLEDIQIEPVDASSWNIINYENTFGCLRGLYGSFVTVWAG